MANATKAQRNYLESLVKKASAEDKALALEVAKAELNITDEWNNVRAENLDGYRWEKHEASILIDVLADPEAYRTTEEEAEEEEAAQAMTAGDITPVTLTEEEVQEITAAEPNGAAYSQLLSRIALAKGVSAHDIHRAYLKLAQEKAHKNGFGKAPRIEREKTRWAQEIMAR